MVGRHVGKIESEEVTTPAEVSREKAAERRPSTPEHTCEVTFGYLDGFTHLSSCAGHRSHSAAGGIAFRA